MKWKEVVEVKDEDSKFYVRSGLDAIDCNYISN